VKSSSPTCAIVSRSTTAAKSIVSLWRKSGSGPSSANSTRSGAGVRMPVTSLAFPAT
jgi:hypothetical protein